MKNKPYRFALYVLARAAASLLYPLPLPQGRKIGSLLGMAAYYIVGKERKRTLTHLKNAFKGKLPEDELRRIARGVFSNLGQNAVEWINIPKIIRGDWFDRNVHPEGLENIEAARKKGRGTIVLASHFGNWELLSLYLNHIGCRGVIIVRKIYIEGFNLFFERMRKSGGNDVLYRDESPKKILKVLKANGYIGLLADQDVENVEGVFVDFFGMPAHTPVAPVKLAMKTGAALIPIFMMRQKGGYRFIVEKEIAIEDTGNEKRDIFVNTVRWTEVLERYIRHHPAEWVWMHRRWKTKPRSVTADEMRGIDSEAKEKYGITAEQLMENAGAEAALCAMEMLKGRIGAGRQARIAVICGKGNNGGDGLVAARVLKERGYDVTAYLLADPKELTRETAVNYDRLRRLKAPEIFAGGRRQAGGPALDGFDLIIDAIFGTGFKGRPGGPAADIISRINSSGRAVLSVDIPSGLDATTGQRPGDCVRASCTLALGLPKRGFYSNEGPRHTGKVIVRNIGFPEELLKNSTNRSIIIP